MKDDKKESKGLDEFGIFLLTGTIDEKVDEAIRFILEANLNGGFEHLTLLINSHGGFISDGFALIDVMAGSKIPIHTVGLGCLASMGLTIFISGSKGDRILTPNTLIMSHQWSGASWGKEHELIAGMKGHVITAEIMLRHYKRHTGLKEEEIKKYLFPPSDMWLTAKEALKLGICDTVKEFKN